MVIARSEALFEEAKQYLPGGVNSPVRAFGSVGAVPRFIKKADGAYIWDEDDNRYVDFVGSWGPMLLGHNQKEITDSVIDACRQGLSYGAATKIEVEMAKRICEMVPSVEMVRMVNSGTEAVMSAVRVARGYTGRDKILKFTGCYHGHSDGMLVKAGSGAMTFGVPDSAGVPDAYTQNTLLARYNDLDSVQKHFTEIGEQIAAIVVEPVAANMGVVLPAAGFLEGLRKLCTQYGSLLIFDEVITGFRLCAGGAQELFGVMPDLTTFGKIIGAGMPVGAYGGKREIMEMVAPAGPVYQAGTLSGNPVAMAAGFKQLTILKKNPQIYENLNQKSDRFFTQLGKIVRQAGLPYEINHIGSLGCLFFTGCPVYDYDSALTADTAAFADYCNAMREAGFYLAPSQFEAIFLSAAHTDEQLDGLVQAASDYLKKKET